MSWTKRELISQAFEEIGLASYAFDLSAEEYESALKRMDMMVSGWTADGVRIGYPLPSSADGSALDQDSGIPDAAIETLVMNLAMRIAPAYGKQLAPDFMTNAKAAYSNLANKMAYPVLEMQLPGTMPSGAGTKNWRNNGGPFLYPPTDGLQDGPDSDLVLE